MSTVCKFFLTNSCKFGDRCRYSHILPDNYRSNPYVYDVRDVRQKTEGVSIMQRLSTPAQHTNKEDIDSVLPEYLKKVIEDVNQIENQKMWPLTCYSLAKSQLNLPGWNDISMEELRWEAYQAQINGTTDAYLANVQELLSHAKEMRKILLTPSPQLESTIREYLKGNVTSNSNQNVPFIMEQPIRNQNEFSFASAFEKQPQPSTFNQMSTNSNSQNFFSPNKSSTNVFNQSPQQQSFFGLKSSFGSSPQSTIQDISSNMDTGYSIFSSSQNHSSQYRLNNSLNRSTGNASLNLSIYSKVEDISKEDYEVFKANTFTLENLPFVPPPKELCH